MPKRKRENRPCLTSTTSPRPNITSTIMSDGDKIWLTSPACPQIENISYRSRASYSQFGGRSLRNQSTLTPCIFFHRPWKNQSMNCKERYFSCTIKHYKGKINQDRQLTSLVSLRYYNYSCWEITFVSQTPTFAPHLNCSSLMHIGIFWSATHRSHFVRHPSCWARDF